MSVKIETVGQRIARARKAKGWSQSDLARAIDVVPATISLLESGRTGSSKHLVAMARVLFVSPDWLATGKGGPRRKAANGKIPNDKLADAAPNLLAALKGALVQCEIAINFGVTGPAFFESLAQTLRGGIATVQD